MTFVAIINTPGYLPDNVDDTPTFDTAHEAWSYLCDERTRHEDEATDGEAYSETREQLATLGTEAHWRHATVREWLAENGLDSDGTGAVTGPTPGYEGGHDLGIAYEVQIMAE